MLRKLPVLFVTAALLTGGVAGSAFAQQPAAKAAPAKVTPVKAAPVQANANQKISIKVNGKPLVLPQAPVSYNGVTYVNASILALALDGTAAWDIMTNSVLIAKDNKLAIRMYKDKTAAYKNGKPVKVPGPARPTSDGSVLVPLVYIAQELGGTVTLDPKTKTYNITVNIQH